MSFCNGRKGFLLVSNKPLETTKNYETFHTMYGVSIDKDIYISGVSTYSVVRTYYNINEYYSVNNIIVSMKTRPYNTVCFLIHLITDATVRY